MHSASERRAILRAAFLITGYVILFLPRSAFDRVVMVRTWAAALFQAGSPAYYLSVATAHLVLLGAMILCWITARGLRRSKEWGRWVGIAACILFLPLFPLFTVLGVAGMYFLSTMPPMGQPDAAETIRLAAARPQDYWTAKRQSKLQPVLMFIFTVVIWSLMGFLTTWARWAGMPVRQLGLEFWLWYSVFLLFQISLHEAGHAIVAWSLFYKVKVISFGPVTITRQAKGWKWSLDWTKLLYGGGYMGAQPASDRNLRWTEAAVVGAGPATSLLSGLVFLAVFVLLPGTSLRTYWWIAALNATLGIMLGVNNLLPVGYSDGSMLFHLVLGTQPGRILLHRLWTGPMEEQLRTHHERAEFDQQAELARTMVKSAIQAGKGNALVIAACHQMLGSALAPTWDYPAAESEYRQALEFEAECTVNPGLAANSWMGLLRVCACRQRVADVGRVYASTLAAIGQQKQAAVGEQRAVSSAMLAQAHFYGVNAQGVLDEAAEGLRLVPAGPEHMILRSVLFYLQTHAYLRLGRTEEGLASSNAGRETLLSPQMPAASSNLAADNLGDLADALWCGGQPDVAVERMPEAIQRLEAGGAMCAAASHRISLCSMLRQLGRSSEGAAWLPDPGRLTPGQRRRLVAEQAEVSLSAGRPGEAIAGCQALLDMWRAEPYDCKTEIAVTEALLARAFLAAADYKQAGTLASRAAEVLGPVQHPDVTDCLITILLARWVMEREWIAPVADEAWRQIDTAPLLSPAEKRRVWEAEMSRIRQWCPDAGTAGQSCPMEAAATV